MSSLPNWLQSLTETLPRWIDRVSHPSGPGRYRFAVDAFEPYDIDSSCMLLKVLQSGAGGEWPLSEQDTNAWIRYLLDFQRPEDGLLIDPAIERHIVSAGTEPTDEERFRVRFWTSRNALMSVESLGGTPRYPLSHQETFATPEAIVTYMENLHWHHPWGAGSWAGAVVLFEHWNAVTGVPGAGEVMQAGIDWLVAQQHPQTGAWHRGENVALHDMINGIFKVWIQIMPIYPFPVQYPEQVIDLCLRGLREDPKLCGTPDACSIFDVALVLDTALRFTDHRREEVAELCRGYLPLFEPMVRPDGAFSYGPNGSCGNHGGVALAPVRDQADAVGTSLLCQAVALVCNLAGLRDELGWGPVTEFGMHLHERTDARAARSRGA